ncbi:MAG TPA: Hsp20/alpha crystallin family protein [Polyangiaceae bacterium]|nr:Hsp20/alpha crystallin family protein [Polyangiaceae bacterium]
MAESRNITTQGQGGSPQGQGGTPQTQRGTPQVRTGELQRGGSWSPFSLMSRMMSDMDRFFDDFGLGRSLWSRGGERSGTSTGIDFVPRMDVFERDGKLTVHADLPGMRQEDVKVNVEDGVLTIAGERSHEHEHEKGGVYRCEREYGSFRRSIALPEGVSPDSIQASFDQGVLEVTMPVPENKQEQKGRAIPINTKQTETRH